MALVRLWKRWIGSPPLSWEWDGGQLEAQAVGLGFGFLEDAFAWSAGEIVEMAKVAIDVYEQRLEGEHPESLCREGGAEAEHITVFAVDREAVKHRANRSEWHMDGLGIPMSLSIGHNQAVFPGACRPQPDGQIAAREATTVLMVEADPWLFGSKALSAEPDWMV
jgi:hypothetical protein